MTTNTRAAFHATAHCLAGCATGEILGLVISTLLGLGAAASIALATVLAFGFGYGLTVGPVLAAGVPLRRALGVALASDTLSIGAMEITDNAIVLAVPGALDAGLGDGVFWWSLALGLAIAFVVAFPVNRALISRGRGHAATHHHAH
jgi:hypothetical protein